MILKIQNSRTFKMVCITMALNLFFTLVLPNQSFALTGGPAQPEFNSFTPIGISDMVDLSSGDMQYNIPLMDVGGYPLNLAYSSGVGMDEEASWVGLGWNLSVGQINRNVRGIPDDFKGDKVRYENYLKPQVNVGASFKVDADAFGMDLPDFISGLGLSATYNNYTGFTMKPTVSGGIQMDNGLTLSASVTNGPDGMSISPNISMKIKGDKEFLKNNELTGSVGTSMNSRQGLSATTLGMSKKGTYKYTKKENQKKVSAANDGLEKMSSVGSSIGYTDQVYTPQRRVGMSTGSFTVNAALGSEIIGAEGQGEITAYGTITKVKESEKNKLVPAYGYANSEVGQSNRFAVHDFNREKDGAFSVNTTNLPVTNYTYDIYSVQGQGVSGMYRPFRNQVGYVYDPYVQDGSFSGNLGVELGAGNAAHAGVDIEFTGVTSYSGVWDHSESDNYLYQYLQESASNNPDYENVHYKNVGDLGADEEWGVFAQQGSYQPVRPEVIGNKFHRRINNEYKRRYNSLNENGIDVTSPIKRNKRHLRNQAIYNLTKEQLSKGIGYGPMVNSANHSPEYTLHADAKSHHVNEVQIIRNDGARYIYGLPAYNITKKEATFSVDSPGDCSTGLVYYDASRLSDPTTLPHDKFFSRITTPAYVHTHLLTSVLSTDYVDRSGNGPTTDDFGSYTKFSYVRMDDSYKWRVPYALNHATYNEGLKTNEEDDQGNYVYGEKELYYIDKIETKTHVAIFSYSDRKDALGVLGETGGRDTGEKMYKLEKISLYSIEEWDGLNPSNSTPIKEVHFVYSYSLCPGVPNNNTTASLDSNELSNIGGKLTLKKVYFTYRNSNMGKYTSYKFNYGEYAPVSDGAGGYYNPDEFSSGTPTLTANSSFISSPSAQSLLSELNPSYNIKGYDTWGNYKPNEADGCGTTDELGAAEFPYTEQDTLKQNRYSSAWSLRKINLPSGGEIDVTYEADDYSSVQDKATKRMFFVRGAGHTNDGLISGGGGTSYLDSGQDSTSLFSTLGTDHKNFLYIEVDPSESTSLSESSIESKYIGDVDEKIYFRFLMNMTKLGGLQGNDNVGKFDYVTGYCEYNTGVAPKIFAHNGHKYLSLPVRLVSKEGGFFPNATSVNPIAKAGWHFGRKYLNKHVYSNQPNGASNDIMDNVTNLLSPQVINNLYEIFAGPNATLENSRIARRFIGDKSWIRLKEPNISKFGGGCRVKQISMSDVWESMNSGASNYQTMKYGQQYDYRRDDGESSGVATYEPVGNKENPFVQPVFSTVEKLLAPDEENYVERPFGESFFPSPQVTYAKVTVSSITAGEAPSAGMQVKRLHKTGKVVTEFYTSKDFPTHVDQTMLWAKEDKQEALASILNLTKRKHATASQGYVVRLNNMNGKQKAQWVYAEGQTAPISGVEYKYRTHDTPNGYNASMDSERGKGRLNNSVTVISPNGTIQNKTIGVEVDMVNDLRQNITVTTTSGVNMNLAAFLVGIIPGLVPMPLPDFSYSEEHLKTASTTKVINTFGILEETIAYDAGAAVSTKNLAWDARTGEVLLTETVDEYNDKYYTLNYPAHWYYKGMGQASANLGLTGTLAHNGSGFYSMSNIGSYDLGDLLIDGDELYLGASATDTIGWVTELSGSQFKLIGRDGGVITDAAGTVEVIRSGHRNLQSAGIMNVTLMRNPLTDDNGNPISSISGAFLNATSWDDWRIINAGAVDYSEDWEVGCECGVNLLTGTYNPYVMNEKGVWRTKSSRTYLTGRNNQTELTPRVEGFFSSFSPMYKKVSGAHWYKDLNDWTFVAEVTKYSPFGFELENRDALDRYSAAQYGYNNTFPMAVGANTQYREIGFDGFEDYGFEGCDSDAHFSFKDADQTGVSSVHSHTGKYSFKVNASDSTTLSKVVECTEPGI